MNRAFKTQRAESPTRTTNENISAAIIGWAHFPFSHQSRTASQYDQRNNADDRVQQNLVFHRCLLSSPNPFQNEDRFESEINKKSPKNVSMTCI